MQLTGQLLDYLGDMQRLTVLSVPNNKFSGSFPATFAAAHPLLETINLGNNDFAGILPSQFDTLPFLSEVVLESNEFSGPIPASFGNGTIGKEGFHDFFLVFGNPSQFIFFYFFSLALVVLNLQNNQLDGTVPLSLYNGQLKELALVGNPLEGVIPSDIGNMLNLEKIRLGQSGMSGDLPSELFTLPKLSTLQLYEASFSGPLLEESFAQLSDTLVSLWLYGNSFTGTIPINFLVSAESLEEIAMNGNPNLTGEITSDLCSKRGYSAGDVRVLRVDCSIVCPEGCCDEHCNL